MEHMISLECTACGGKMQISADSEMVVCLYCGNQYMFKLPARTPRSTEPAVRRKPLAPRPAQVTVQKKGQSLEIRWRWFSVKYIPFAFFCVAWDAFLCFWYSIALGMFTKHAGPGLFFIIFPVAHLAVGVGMTYYTLAGFLNHSTLRVERNFFIVQHDPLIWWGEKKISINQLDQFYCQMKTRMDEHHTQAYKLCALLKDGRKIEMLPDLDSPDIALFIEQQLESWLKIPDQPVAGELAY